HWTRRHNLPRRDPCTPDREIFWIAEGRNDPFRREPLDQSQVLGEARMDVPPLEAGTPALDEPLAGRVGREVAREQDRRVALALPTSDQRAGDPDVAGRAVRHHGAPCGRILV